MGLGSLLAGRRVTETLAGKVTRISPDDGLAANLVTSALVGLASLVAAPVSTTHVSTGAIVGIGLHRHQVKWKLVRELLRRHGGQIPLDNEGGVAARVAGDVPGWGGAGCGGVSSPGRVNREEIQPSRCLSKMGSISTLGRVRLTRDGHEQTRHSHIP
jgi:hypothetical protein